MAALHAFLTEPFLGTAIWFWLAFLAIVIVLLVSTSACCNATTTKSACAKACCCPPATSPAAWPSAAGSGTPSAPPARWSTTPAPGRTVAIDGQRVRHGDDLQFLRHPRRYQHQVLFWHPRRHRPAGDHDRPGRRAGEGIRLDHVRVRRLPAVQRREDAVQQARGRTRPGAQPGAALPAQAHAGDQELHEHHFVRLPDASGKLVRYATRCSSPWC